MGPKAPPQASVIATTYNQSADLGLFLQSLWDQSVRDFEVVIADDGSGEETRAVVERFGKQSFGERLKHVWHEDEGYRKCRILNAAIRASRGEWLIFTDSDLILHPRFVEDHLAMAAPNTMFMGRRLDLSRPASDWVRQRGARGPVKLTAPFYAEIVKSSLNSPGSIRGIKRAFRIAHPWLASALNCFHVPDLLGSNFSIDRELLCRVNGFDESLEHYWGEDGDLFIRVRNAGGTIIGRKSFAVQFHLWHPLRTPQAGAQERYRAKLEDRDYKKCRDGLVKCEPA